MTSIDIIAKRFKFDLEMGRFKNIPEEDTHAFLIKNNLEISLFTEVLGILGFSWEYDCRLQDINKADGISVSKEDKSYWFFEDDDEYSEYDNELPYYLKVDDDFD